MGARRTYGEGTIYRDAARGGWVGQAWIDGRRRKVRAATKKDAAAKLGKLMHGDETARRADPRLTVSKLLAEWARTLDGRGLAPATVEVHRWAVEVLTAELGHAQVTALDAATVERAFTRMANGSKGRAPLGRGSLVKVRSTLRQALRWAQARQLATHNAAAVADLPAHASPETGRRSLDADGWHRLDGALAGHPLRPYFTVVALTGLRPGEAAGLCVDALDLVAGTLTVQRAVQLQRGRPVLVDALKTTGSRRTVAVSPAVVEVLRDHLDRTGFTGGLVFRASDGGPLWPSTVRGDLADASGRAGIRPAIRPNELRHTAATRMVDAGLLPHEVADVLGHRSTRMVDAVYRHRPPVIRGAELLT